MKNNGSHTKMKTNSKSEARKQETRIMTTSTIENRSYTVETAAEFSRIQDLENFLEYEIHWTRFPRCEPG